MFIEQLEYIVEVAKTNSISDAAESLHISQSGLSQSIMKLEDELGIQIFIRTRSGTYLTEEGRLVVEKAQEILLKLEELRQLSKNYKTNIKGNLKVSVMPNMMMLLFKVLLLFRREYPGINIEIEEKGSYDILEDLKHNKTDIGLINVEDKDMDEIQKQFVFEKLVKGKMKIFVGRNFPLVTKDSITPEQLRKYPLVLFKSKYIKQFVKTLSELFGPLDVLFYTDSNDVIKKAIMEGIGIGIGFSHLIKFDPQVLQGEIITVDIEGYEHKNEIYFGWVKSKGKKSNPAMDTFVQLIKNQLQEENFFLL